MFNKVGARAPQLLAADGKLHVSISFALGQMNKGLQDTVRNEEPKARVAKDLLSRL